MSKSFTMPSRQALNGALLLAAAALLPACTADRVSFDDAYEPQTHYERYPIKVAKAPVRMEVDSRRGGLEPNQINAITAFARSAGTATATKIVIARPSGGGGSRSGAQHIYKLLIGNGVSPSQIRQTTYRGGAGAPVTLSYTRAVAVTKECGDWSSDLTHTPGNGAYPNLGCSVQHNIAQMVTNPTDFEAPSAPSAIYSNNRSLVRSPEDANVRRVFYYFN